MSMSKRDHEDFYQRLRTKVREWARTKEGKTSEVAGYVLLAPDLFHLLVRLSFDPDVPVREKAKIGAALAYFVSPIDLLPEFLVGPIGYLDDVGLAIFVLHSVLENVPHERVVRHWAGEADLLKVTEQFLAKADSYLGSGLWGRIKRIAGLDEPVPDVDVTANTTAKTKAPAARKGSGKARAPTKAATKKAGKKRSATTKATKKEAAKLGKPATDGGGENGAEHDRTRAPVVTAAKAGPKTSD